MHEKYLDALYRFEGMLADDFAAFVGETEKSGLDAGRIKYADCLMHLAKNLRKEIFAEEGMSPEEIEGYSGGNQGYGRAIRTTPGPGMQSGNKMGRSMKSAYSGNDGWSGARDSRGRFASSGAEASGFLARMQKMADMTADHDERETIMRMIDRLKTESEQ